MPTPPFSYKTVVGTYKAPNGDPGAGHLRFVPSTTVTDSAGHVIVPPTPVFATLDGSGAFSVSLLVTDLATTNPVGWTWILTELFPPQREVAFQIPSAGGSTIQLADLTPVADVDPSYAYASLATALALDGRVTTAEATVAAAQSAAAASAASAAASALSAQIANNMQVSMLMGVI